MNWNRECGKGANRPAASVVAAGRVEADQEAVAQAVVD
jgi:hypothetical protein